MLEAPQSGNDCNTSLCTGHHSRPPLLANVTSFGLVNHPHQAMTTTQAGTTFRCYTCNEQIDEVKDRHLSKFGSFR